ncbi:hypothetical protein [Paenibacillus tianmuensis]|uniref:hypothetical protein n=1 Tax=Paenibacillus tianmuensis TaxID=624147 RepID=UPI001C26C84E|nr:hypothetical protein [Paenibacillus tianmuensis]
MIDIIPLDKLPCQLAQNHQVWLFFERPVCGKEFISSIGANYELNITSSLNEDERKLKKTLK